MQVIACEKRRVDKYHIVACQGDGVSSKLPQDIAVRRRVWQLMETSNVPDYTKP